MKLFFGRLCVQPRRFPRLRFFPVSGNGLEGFYAHIQFKAYEEGEGIDINDDHDHHGGTYRAIEGIESAEIIHVDRESD